MRNNTRVVFAALLGLALTPANAQEQSSRAPAEGSVRIEAPAGVRVVEDASTQLAISHSSITFAIGGSTQGSGSLGVAGFVGTAGQQSQLLQLGSGENLVLSGTTLDSNVLSLSVGGFESSPLADPRLTVDAFLRVVLAQYN
jgi:hypothetical protein